MARGGEKVHNAEPAKKAELRLRLVRELGGPAACTVLETHSGPGVMRRLAYAGVRDWLGVDEDPRSPAAIHADNCDVMRAIDLQRFNLFDIDAFGSPWEQLWLVAQRRRIASGERVAFALTSGQQGKLCARAQNVQRAGWSLQMVEAIGASEQVAFKYFVGDRGADLVARKLIAAWFPTCNVLLGLSAHSRERTAWYFGCLLEGR
jgi:hypothetical protein